MGISVLAEHEIVNLVRSGQSIQQAMQTLTTEQLREASQLLTEAAVAAETEANRREKLGYTQLEEEE